MKNIHIYFIAFSVLVFTACGGSSSEEQRKAEEVPGKAQTCTYEYNNDSTLIKWTAYKLTERAGVEGSFTSFTVSGTSVNEDPIQALTGASFSIETQSTKTNDTLRDGKIFRYFFKVLKAESITGKIISFSADGTTAKIAITMNEIEKEIEAPVKWDGEIVMIKTELNLEDWNYNDAMANLNKQCKEKHTGTDGITKVWPDVSIMVRTILTKKCAE